MSATVLVVDDSPTNLKLLGAFLTREGYEVEFASDGREGVEVARETSPDVVLMDVKMPVMDGFEACEKLKAEPETAAIPVIFLSAMDEPQDKVRGLELGAADYVTRPFNRAEVLARVRTQIRLRELNRAMRRHADELVEKQRRLDEDLKAAAYIQRSLLPRPGLELPRVRCRWIFRPSEKVGGDIFNVVPLSEDHLEVYIVDVSGHGVPAALITVSVAQSLSPQAGTVTRRRPRAGGYEVLSPSEVLRSLDEEYPVDRFGRLFTIAYLTLDTLRGELRYCTAAHPPPILQRVDGTTEQLREGGSFVGMGDLLPFLEGRARLHPGDRLFLYTDGIVEYSRGGGEMFGMERFLSLLAETRSLELEEVSPLLLERVSAFGGGCIPGDDISLLVLELEEPGAAPERPDDGVLPALPPGHREGAARSLQLSIDSRVENVRWVGLAVVRLCESLGFDREVSQEIRLATVEAATNAVQHAYGGEAGHRVEVLVVEADEALEVRVIDHGWPAPPEALESAGKIDFDAGDLESLPERRRGLFLMRQLMDEVRLVTGDEGNVVVMRRALPAQS